MRARYVERLRGKSGPVIRMKEEEVMSEPTTAKERYAQALRDGDTSTIEAMNHAAQKRDVSSDPVDEQIIRAYFWDIKNRIVQFEGEPTVNWLVRDLINSLHGNPPDPEEFNRILALVKEGKGDD